MSLETALPTAEAPAQASGQQDTADQLATQATEGQDAKPEGEGEAPKPKPEKTEEQRRIERLERAIDRRTRRAAETIGAKDAELAQVRAELERLRTTGQSQDNRTQQGEDEPLTLSRAELQQLVNREAERLAPTLTQQRSEMEHRKGVIDSLAKELGTERFDALAEDLDEALGGLQRNGKATPAADAIFAADDPKAVIEYLANPDHADEAESIGRMDPIRAGRAIAKLELKLEQTKAQDKPRRSNAEPPVEPARAGGGNVNDMPDPSNVKAYIAWANKQDRRP